MKQNSIVTNDEKINFKEARKRIEEMNLINGFLFDSVCENKEDAKIVVGNILKAVFGKEIEIDDVTSQKTMKGIDINYHGICMDVHINESQDSKPTATVFDMEMEDRPADKKHLPKRLRYYSSLHDVKALETSADYDFLPDFVSIVILSYDPFDAGDMFYQAQTTLTTHPDIEYKDSLTHIYLYCNGRPNFDAPDSPFKMNPEHSKKLKEMLKYIVSGDKPTTANSDIEELDSIVSKIKKRKEVTTAYMRQWDRELSIKRETREETRKETRKETKIEDALETIRFAHEDGLPDSKTRERLKRFMLDDDTINELFDQIAKEEAALAKS